MNHRKSIALLRERPLFEFAVDELYAYTELTGRKKTCVELAGFAENFGELATNLPLIRYEDSARSAATREAQRVYQVEDINAESLEHAAFVFMWGMRIEAKEAAREAKLIFESLQALSDGTLTEVKRSLLMRLAKESKNPLGEQLTSAGERGWGAGWHRRGVCAMATALGGHVSGSSDSLVA
jgi:hypothetical protein